MGYTKSMKLVYFTQGESLQDRQVREQVLRIPEVLSEIRKVKSSCADPVMSFLYLEGGVQAWVDVVQRGLFLRLKNKGFKYSGLIKRKRFAGVSELDAALVPILHSKREIEIYVVGPSFDDLHLHIRRLLNEHRLNCEVTFSEVIARDRKLRWFWSELRGQEAPQLPPEDVAAALH